MTTRPLVRIDEEKLAWAKEHDPETYREVVENLAELDRLVEDNPLQVFYPHPKQKVFLGQKTKFKAFLGGNQSGKSLAGVADDLIQAVDEECLPNHLKPYKRFDPPFFGRIITPDFTETMEGVVFEKIRELAPKHQLLGGGWDKAYDKQLRKLRFQNGSWIDFLTYEQDLDKHGGVTLDRVHFDEEPPGEKGRKIYLQALVRTMKRGGDITLTMTPELGMSWVYDEIYERRHADDVTVVEVATDDNPHIPPEEVEAAFERMSEEEQAAKRRGKFVAFGGLVLLIDPDKHVVDQVSPEHVQGLTTYVVIDPGAAQGAVLWMGFDKDDVLLAFDELYPSGSTETRLEVLVPKIQAKNEYWGIEPAYVIDPSSRNRFTDGSAGVEDQYYQYGIYPTRGKNDRFVSIMQLRTRVAANPPGLLLTRNCPWLKWELGRWRVAEDERTAQDRPKRGQGGDSFATVGPDHLGDCLRYGAMEWFWGPPEHQEHQQLGPRLWTPGTAPPQSWFGAERERPPLGVMS